jgi:hypothetical protein
VVAGDALNTGSGQFQRDRTKRHSR